MKLKQNKNDIFVIVGKTVDRNFNEIRVFECVKCGERTTIPMPRICLECDNRREERRNKIEREIIADRKKELDGEAVNASNNIYEGYL